MLSTKLQGRPKKVGRCSVIILLSLLFFSAFSSATLLPGSSELVFSTLLLQYPQRWLSLLVVASVGNTLGSLFSFAMGWGLMASLKQRLVGPPNLARQAKVKFWLNKYGPWSLLLSWVPLVGDLLCLLAGAAKLSVWQCAIAMLIGKTARYGLILAFGASLASI
ncbi:MULTISPECIES: YqaA family protein [unclassified Agarivorans]|uniref:YqaA family protein n=1 Tax=unclassified Agarivorans TaxID=2636026 RepID=UPI003D7C5CED